MEDAAFVRPGPSAPDLDRKLLEALTLVLLLRRPRGLWGDGYPSGPVVNVRSNAHFSLVSVEYAAKVSPVQAKSLSSDLFKLMSTLVLKEPMRVKGALLTTHFSNHVRQVFMIWVYGVIKWRKFITLRRRVQLHRYHRKSLFTCSTCRV